MSGEMNTSLGNGFSNHMLMLFVSHVNNLHLHECVIEGDDCLSAFIGRIPTSKMFEDLGFTIKIKTHSKLTSASFCGLLFDDEARQLVTDPRKVLLNFSWFHPIYRRARAHTMHRLLRSKALSIAHQFPSCPIVSKFAGRILELTRHIRCVKIPFGLSVYQREELTQLLSKTDEPIFDTIHVRTRELVEELFNIPLYYQTRIEKQIDDMVLEKPFVSLLFLDLLDKDPLFYFDKFVMTEAEFSAMNLTPRFLYTRARGECGTFVTKYA